MHFAADKLKRLAVEQKLFALFAAERKRMRRLPRIIRNRQRSDSGEENEQNQLHDARHWNAMRHDRGRGLVVISD